MIVNQMTAKWALPEDVMTTVSLTLTRSQKLQSIFKFTSLSKITIKIEAYAETGLTQCYNYHLTGHIWVHCKRTPRYLWCRGSRYHREFPERGDETNTKCYNYEAQHPSSYRGYSWRRGGAATENAAFRTSGTQWPQHCVETGNARENIVHSDGSNSSLQSRGR
jgi:hypothetical protein